MHITNVCSSKWYESLKLLSFSRSVSQWNSVSILAICEINGVLILAINHISRYYFEKVNEINESKFPTIINSRIFEFGAFAVIVSWPTIKN